MFCPYSTKDGIYYDSIKKYIIAYSGMQSVNCRVNKKPRKDCRLKAANKIKSFSAGVYT